MCRWFLRCPPERRHREVHPSSHCFPSTSARVEAAISSPVFWRFDFFYFSLLLCSTTKERELWSLNSNTVNNNNSVFIQFARHFGFFVWWEFVCWAQGSELNRGRGRMSRESTVESLSSENPEVLPVRNWYLFTFCIDIFPGPIFYSISDTAIFSGHFGYLVWRYGIGRGEHLKCLRLRQQIRGRQGDSAAYLAACLRWTKKYKEKVSLSLSRKLVLTSSVSRVGTCVGTFTFWHFILVFFVSGLQYNKEGCAGL